MLDHEEMCGKIALPAAQKVATVAAAYEAGVFMLDEEGYLDRDDDAFDAQAARLNPTVPWWTDDV